MKKYSNSCANLHKFSTRMCTSLYCSFTWTLFSVLSRFNLSKTCLFLSIYYLQNSLLCVNSLCKKVTRSSCISKNVIYPCSYITFRTLQSARSISQPSSFLEPHIKLELNKVIPEHELSMTRSTFTAWFKFFACNINQPFICKIC